MANTLKLKRSSTPAAVPGSLAAGELAINLVDRKLYFGNGSSVLELSGAAVTVADAAPTSPTPRNGDLWWNSSTGELFIRFDDGSSAQWVGIVAGTSSDLASHLVDAAAHASLFDALFDDVAAGFPRNNYLANGNFTIYQRLGDGSGATVADNTYGSADRWKSLLDGAGTATFGIDTSDGISALVMNNTSGSGAKFGICQHLPTLESTQLRSKEVTLSARIKVSSATNVPDVRMAIIGWTGTADSPGDPISAWNASGVNPTFSGTAANTPADLNPTTDWVTYSVTGTLPAGTNNVTVMIWSNSTTPGATDYLYVTDVQLEVGAEPSLFVRPSLAETLQRCLPFYQRLRQQGATGVTAIGTGLNSSTTVARIMIPLLARMRAAPAFTASATANQFSVRTTSTDVACSSAPTSVSMHPERPVVNFTVASGLTAGQGSIAQFVDGNGWLDFDAEI